MKNCFILRGKVSGLWSEMHKTVRGPMTTDATPKWHRENGHSLTLLHMIRNAQEGERANDHRCDTKVAVWKWPLTHPSPSMKMQCCDECYILCISPSEKEETHNLWKPRETQSQLPSLVTCLLDPTVGSKENSIREGTRDSQAGFLTPLPPLMCRREHTSTLHSSEASQATFHYQEHHFERLPYQATSCLAEGSRQLCSADLLTSSYFKNKKHLYGTQKQPETDWLPSKSCDPLQE